MKTTLLLLGACGAAAVLSSCTTTTTTAQTDKRPGVEITSEKRSYTQQELQKRGRPTVAGALEAQDASVYVSGRR
jgi:hypothetical protein